MFLKFDHPCCCNASSSRRNKNRGIGCTVKQGAWNFADQAALSGVVCLTQLGQLGPEHANQKQCNVLINFLNDV
jgi:hypothetical protein